MSAEAGFLAYLGRRVLWALFLLVAASVLVYVIFWLVPANPAAIRPASPFSTPDAQAAVRNYLHLGEPVWKQYLGFVWRILRHGSLGQSYWSRGSVDSIIATDAPVTASLVLGSAVLWLSLSLPLGVVAALRPRSLVDRTSTLVVLLGQSAHPVWLGLMLSYLIGYRLGLTPIQGYCSFFGHSGPGRCGGPVPWATHLILPWLTFTALFLALYVRLIRATVSSNLAEDYVKTARAKGAPEGRVVIRHVLRNSLGPVVTIVGMDLGLAMGGALFVENVFGLPGLGREIVHAYQFDDYPLIVGIVLFSAVVIVLLNLVVDILYGVLDPRVRLA